MAVVHNNNYNPMEFLVDSFNFMKICIKTKMSIKKIKSTT